MRIWTFQASGSAKCVVLLGVGQPGSDAISVMLLVTQFPNGRLLDGRHGPTPFELVEDGDLLLFIGRMLRLRGLDMVRVTKVKGHADEVYGS